MRLRSLVSRDAPTTIDRNHIDMGPVAVATSAVHVTRPRGRIQVRDREHNPLRLILCRRAER
jgi:hypothetical protein